jgi:hypothetical protein
LCEINPLDLVRTFHEGLLVCNADLTVAYCSSGETFTVTRKGTPRDKKGRQ